eukprot:4432423-Amphidinium_carterae.1
MTIDRRTERPVDGQSNPALLGLSTTCIETRSIVERFSFGTKSNRNIEAENNKRNTAYCHYYSSVLDFYLA